MHALFKLNKQKNKPEEEEDFWSDDSNDSDDFEKQTRQIM